MNTHIDTDQTIPSEDEVYAASNLLKLASDPTRFKILWALLHGEHSVGQLAKHINAQPAAVSQHLGKLRLAQVVKVRREGNTMYYSTDDTHVHDLIERALSHAKHK